VNPANSREVTVRENLKPWFQEAKIRLFAVPGEHRATIEGDLYCGETLKIIWLKARLVKRVLFRNDRDKITIVISEYGQARGNASGHAFRAIPNRFAFMLQENEVVELQIDSELVSGLVLQINISSLTEECKIHGYSDTGIGTLRETLPGHEDLMNACARQLLGYSDQYSRRLTSPLERSILSLLAGLVIESEESKDRKQDQRDSPQQTYVSYALRYFEQNLAEPVCLTDVCRACNVSARTLQVAFNSVMGRSPLHVLNELRLGRLRQLLQSQVAVSAACRQVGLQPSGRVSGSYKEMFGELPSDTLRKNTRTKRKTRASSEQLLRGELLAEDGNNGMI
jgi:AraC-like DNA-binding protein